MSAPAGGKERASPGSLPSCLIRSNNLPNSSPALKASGHCLSCSSIGSFWISESARSASSSRIMRSIRVQPNRHSAMRSATTHFLHFFFSFAAISFCSILVAIETGLRPHTAGHGPNLCLRGRAACSQPQMAPLNGGLFSDSQRTPCVFSTPWRRPPAQSDRPPFHL